MALENIVTGVTHFELAETDVERARYAFFCHDVNLIEKRSIKAAQGRKG